MERSGNEADQREPSGVLEDSAPLIESSSSVEGTLSLVSVEKEISGEGALGVDVPLKRKRSWFGEDKGEEEEEKELPLVAMPKVAPRKWALKKKKFMSKKAKSYRVGEVATISSSLKSPDLDRLRTMYHIPKDIVMREVSPGEAACSDVSPDVCLYEHMF